MAQSQYDRILQKSKLLETAVHDQNVINSRKEKLKIENAILKEKIAAALTNLSHFEALNGKVSVEVPIVGSKAAAKQSENVLPVAASAEVKNIKAEPQPEPETTAQKSPSPQTKPKKEKKPKIKSNKPNPNTDTPKPVNLARVKLIVGQIVDVQVHPTADGLYLEKMDCGEQGKEPRTIISGLVKHVDIEKMRMRKVIVVANLKPAKLVGIFSEGMVLCAKEGADKETQKVELINVPDCCQPGDVITTDEFLAAETWTEPDTQMNPKKKIFEKIQPDLATDGSLVAGWKGENGWMPFLVKGREAETRGKFVSDTIKNGGIS